MTDVNLNIGSEAGRENKEPVLLLSIHNQRDSRLIRDFLPDFLTINASDNGISGRSFDLCILDEASFRQNKQSLQRMKEQAAPIFLPFLLLSQNPERIRNDETAWEIADDVVYIPASTKLLKSRIQMLLKQREYSLRLEEKNRQLEEKNEQLRIYKQAINSTNAGVLITDANQEDMPVTFCNQGFQDLTGYEEDEILGRNCRFLQNDDRNQQAIDKIRSLIENKEQGQVRLRNYRKDGTMFWNDLSIAPIRDEDGEVNYFVGIQRDVSELVETQKKLREEKEKYRLITENSTDMISRHAPDGTYLYVSQACKELTGYEPEELIGKNPFDNMHPADRRDMKQIEEPFAGGEVVKFSFRKQVRDGSYKWVETSMRPIYDDKTGELKEIQASTRDVSKRVEYRQGLEDEKEFTDLAIECLPELFFVVDENQNFVRWNNLVEKELGYSSEEIDQMNPLEFYQEQDHEFIAGKIQEAFGTGSAEAEVKMRTKDGNLIPYYVTAQNFQKNEKNYIVGSCVNLTDWKKAQFEIEQKQRLLDAIINQSKSLIYVKDQDKKYRLVNENYVEIFDRDRENILGKTVREVHGREFEKQVEKNDDAVLKHGKTVETEEAIPVDGEIRYYHSIKYPLKGVPGFEKCMCGISTDITDLKQATNQLQERIKEQRCLYKISSLPEQDLTIDELLEEAVTYLPDGWYRPEATEAAITFNGKTYRTEDYYETTYMLSAESKRIANKPLTIQVAYTDEDLDTDPFLGEEHKLITTIADTLSSQIDRILAQKKLKESEQRWEGLVNNDPDLIQLSTVGGIIKFINPAGAKMYGVDDPQKLIGKNFFDLLKISESDLEIIKERMQKALEGESIPPRVYKIETLDGTERYVEIQSVSITLENGEKGLQQVAQDITSRKRYEQELKETIVEKETLLQEIHHRVKNNLAVVSGMLQLQAFNTENQELKDTLSDSENRIKTMALIHEKLYQSNSLSKIDFGFYIRDLIDQLQAVSAQGAKVEISLDYDSFKLNINQAVPCALIMNEVISNSFKHAFEDREKGKITVSLKENGDVINVKISDNGTGFAGDIEELENKSLGFTIIKTLFRQLDANYNFNGSDGFTLKFSFTKQEVKGSSSALL